MKLLSFFSCIFTNFIILSSYLINTTFIFQHFGKNTQFFVGKENSGFRNRSYSDVSGKNQNMEKPKTSEKARITIWHKDPCFVYFLMVVLHRFYCIWVHDNSSKTISPIPQLVIYVFWSMRRFTEYDIWSKKTVRYDIWSKLSSHCFSTKCCTRRSAASTKCH